MDFPARLILQGYVHQFQVNINDTTVFFEPDEEGNYRALVKPDPGGQPGPLVEMELLQLLHDKITGLHGRGR